MPDLLMHRIEQAEASVSELVKDERVSTNLRDVLEGSSNVSILNNDELDCLLAYAKLGRWVWFQKQQNDMENANV